LLFRAQPIPPAIEIHASDTRMALRSTGGARDVPVMKCRMCSQQLTSPGRLCRECERELERARRADLVAGELAEVVTRSHAANARTGWTTKLRAPRHVIALAFCVGVAAAGSAGVVQHESSRTARSVMLDVTATSVTRGREAPEHDAVASRDGRSAAPER
jgi:hypothetical protein